MIAEVCDRGGCWRRTSEAVAVVVEIPVVEVR